MIITDREIKIINLALESIPNKFELEKIAIQEVFTAVMNRAKSMTEANQAPITQDGQSEGN